MQNVIHDAFEQFRLSTPPPAMSQRRLEHSSSLISDPETEIVHSHLWKARCKQVALKSTAVTGGVRKRRRSRPETIGSLATCRHPKRKVTFHRLVAEVAQDVKADWRFQSSVVPSVLGITVSSQSNLISASDSLVSDVTSIPNRSFVNKGCDGVSSVFVAKVGEIDEKLGHRKEQSFDKNVKVNGNQNDDVAASIPVGVSLKQHMQCSVLCGNGREHHALHPFDERPKSKGLSSVGETVTSIRDKGGGLAHRPVEHGSGVKYEEEDEYFDNSAEKDDQDDHGNVVSKKELVETKTEVKKKGVLKEKFEGPCKVGKAVLVDRIKNVRVSDCVVNCASLVGMAVGKEKFRDDAKQVMEVLMSLQGSQMETDDPTTSYLLQAWARLCKCLGQDFLPYMSVVMPPLLQSAQLKPDVTITSADDNSDIDDSDDDSMETITLGDKRIGIKTSVLEEKATACNMLCCYADELKEGFFPWIDQVAPTLVPLLKFYFHEEVRKAAVSAMPELLLSAKLAIEKGLAQGRNETYIKQLSDYIVPALVEALHKEPDTEICANILDAINECIQISGPLLDESQVRSIVEEIKQVITASSSRKRERAERTQAEDFDDEERELIKEENEQEEEVFDQVGEILGTLIKTFKASFLPFFDELSTYLTPMWGKDKTPEERRIAICIFDDVAEQCREAALKYYDTFLPFLLEACNDESPDVRQAAVYGLGVCAEFGGTVIKPLISVALSRLNVVIQHPSAKQPDNIMAYDNAVSALGKICQYHRDSIDAAQVIPAWLSCLPIKGDVIEAKVVHDQLCSMVERSDTDLLGPNNQYLSKIVQVFAEVLCAGKELATEQTASRMINLLKQLQQTLPPQTLASTWSSLQPQQQLALQSILSS